MDDPAFLIPAVDINTQTILLHAAHHDIEALKPFLRIPGNASVQDPETDITPLHAAIDACGVAKSETLAQEGDSIVDTNGTNEKAIENGDKNLNGGKNEAEDEEVDIEQAKKVVQELFLSGAIWNDLDSNDETPGCLAWRLGQKEIYELCVQAGVRAEMLLGLMGRYEALDSGEDEDEEEPSEVEVEAEREQVRTENGHDIAMAEEPEEPEEKEKRDVNSEDYLNSTLTFTPSKLLDSSNNSVMMSWETSIMSSTVSLLLPPTPPSTSPKTGQRILNIGFGMGIIDRMFAATNPHSHHIIEAHPSVLAHLSSPESDFGTSWKEGAPDGGEYKIHAGRWQDVLPSLLEKGEVFDAIYFDTFGEDYSALKLFFTEYVPGLMDEGGRFGFFNGLGADRRVCYDVYTRVSELDLSEAGLEVEWTVVPVEELGAEGEGEWEGVRRRYWTLDEYRLPICTFLG